ncbi:hypothetical protein V1478_013603 [Vespula squamosa]|uniref:Uncharacterized protein n=1 Tax=Vespula squamosa TaxID=30214 RepID=A0ABD2A6G3_VESSQ
MQRRCKYDSFKGAKREDSLGLLRARIKSCRAPIVVWHWSGCRRRVRAVREESAVKSTCNMDKDYI